MKRKNLVNNEDNEAQYLKNEKDNFLPWTIREQSKRRFHKVHQMKSERFEMYLWSYISETELLAIVHARDGDLSLRDVVVVIDVVG